MTKNEEMQILEDTIMRLGNDSYCGDFLFEVLVDLERDIHDDFCPEHSFAKMRQDARNEVLRARVEANQIITEAKIKAKQITDKAMAYDCSVRENVAGRLREALRAVEE